MRVDGTGDSTEVDDLSTRAISSDRIGEAIGRPVYDGFVDVQSEDPEPPDAALERRSRPSSTTGRTSSTACSGGSSACWRSFGFGYLAYDERKRGPRGERPRRVENGPGQRARSMPPSTGSIAPDTNDAAGDSRKAAARPNSSGSP